MTYNCLLKFIIIKIMKKIGLVILFLILFLKMQGQSVSFYEKNDESFADVKISENLIFTCRVGGLKNNGETVVLLHGFPETSHMWKGLIKLLSQNGFNVIAPDQRGYSSGARPKRIEDYKIGMLSKDVIDIVNAFGSEKFHLVGHDWGAAVGWALSAFHRDKIISYTALSVPHLDSFGNAIKNDKVQKKKSYYMDLFKIQYLPEFYFKIFNYRYLRKLWTSSNQNEIDSYIEVFSQDNALKSALNWYRATNLEGSRQIGDIFVPTLMIYGTNDMAIGVQGVDETEKYMKSFYSLKKINASHWLIQESFDFVSNEILNHLKKFKFIK